MPLISGPDGVNTTAILLYEAPNGNITTLCGFLVDSPDSDDTQWQWQNVSDSVYSLIRSLNVQALGWLSPPLGSMSQQVTLPKPNKSPSQDVYISFFNPYALTDINAPAIIDLQILNWTSTCEIQPLILSAFHRRQSKTTRDY